MSRHSAGDDGTAHANPAVSVINPPLVRVANTCTASGAAVNSTLVVHKVKRVFGPPAANHQNSPPARSELHAQNLRRLSDVSNRREAAVADRGRGRRSWARAEKGPRSGQRMDCCRTATRKVGQNQTTLRSGARCSSVSLHFALRSRCLDHTQAIENQRRDQTKEEKLLGEVVGSNGDGTPILEA
jgi:hypothetical protein